MADGRWGAIVIGSGFGGSTTALKLAEAGLSVLVLERGVWVERDDTAWDTRAIHIDKKYQGAVPYEVVQDRKPEVYQPNQTVGGSSIFYGAASFRLREEDFRRKSEFSNTRDNGFVDWPVQYESFSRHYDDAERMLGVLGVEGLDPTEPPRSSGYCGEPPEYTHPARTVAGAAENLGLKPFPIPLAINFNGNNGHHSDNGDGRSCYSGNGSNVCTRCLTCDLFPCKIGAKNDLSMTILPAARKLGAEIRDQISVRRLIHKNGRISGVECHDIRTGETVTLESDLVVASCGAIPSARLLLESGLGELAPNGDLIGRYLMRHCSGIVVALFPFKTNPEMVFHKQVAITDFYFGGRNGSGPAGPWGMIQSLHIPPREFIEAEASFVGNAVGQATYSRNIFLMCIAEDAPQYENRVTLHPSRRDAYGQSVASVRHFYSRDDLGRRKALYSEAIRIMRKGGGMAWIRLPVKTFSHAMGTCRFGDDPQQSVLDPNCRFWGVPNLFVVDASFMPTSAAVNPSLTIAANGLRVGEHIAGNWDDIVGDGGASAD